jgi:hypothetical protein
MGKTEVFIRCSDFTVREPRTGNIAARTSAPNFCLHERGISHMVYERDCNNPRRHVCQGWINCLWINCRRLREHYQKRDRLRLVLDYRKKYLDLLLRGGEEDGTQNRIAASLRRRLHPHPRLRSAYRFDSRRLVFPAITTPNSISKKVHPRGNRRFPISAIPHSQPSATPQTTHRHRHQIEPPPTE